MIIDVPRYHQNIKQAATNMEEHDIHKDLIIGSVDYAEPEGLKIRANICRTLVEYLAQSVFIFIFARHDPWARQSVPRPHVPASRYFLQQIQVPSSESQGSDYGA